MSVAWWNMHFLHYEKLRSTRTLDLLGMWPVCACSTPGAGRRKCMDASEIHKFSTIMLWSWSWSGWPSTCSSRSSACVARSDSGLWLKRGNPTWCPFYFIVSLFRKKTSTSVLIDPNHLLLLHATGNVDRNSFLQYWGFYITAVSAHCNPLVKSAI